MPVGPAFDELEEGKACFDLGREAVTLEHLALKRAKTLLHIALSARRPPLRSRSFAGSPLSSNPVTRVQTSPGNK